MHIHRRARSRKRTHSLASVLLTSKIKGLPSALACSLTTVSFQPIRVFAKKIDSIARDDSFLIGCVPAGGVIPKIFATIKLPIRACSSAAPTAISREKCFFSVPSSNGLPVCGFTTNWQIIACGTPKPTRILTLLRCSGVATKDFRPLRPGFPEIAPVPFFLTRIKCAWETDTTFAIGWKGRYRIEGPAFVYSDEDNGQVARSARGRRTRRGDPCHRSRAQRRPRSRNGSQGRGRLAGNAG